MTWTSLFFSLGTGGVALAVNVATVTSSAEGYLLSILLFLLSALCVHIWSLRPAANLSLAGVLYSYMERLVALEVGRVLLWRFNNQCRDVEKTQEKTLLKILNTGKHTVYGRDHNMADIKTVEDFRSRVHLSDYSNYKPYVDRSLAGEKNILFKENVDFYGATSGTTSGKSKIFPVNRKVNVRDYFAPLIVPLATVIQTLPGVLGGRFQSWFWLPNSTTDSDNGVKIGTMSATFLKYSPHNTTPREGYTVHDEHTGQYIHMVFALREREVGMLMAMNSSVLFMVLSLVENNWPKLVLDIRRGRLDSELDIPDDVRAALNKQLTPDPTRADELEDIFRSGFKEMVPRIWPDLAGIVALCTGTFILQSRLVQDRYVGHDIPIFCNWHMATEGVYGVLLFDDDVYKEGTREVRDDYVILPNLNFYEFIPTDQLDGNTPQPVLAHEVETDAMYELVVTTPRSLYRYRTGDVVRVVGFRGTTPKYQMLQR